MHDRCPYDYAVIRVVPRVERGEFVNVGVILSCTNRKYLNVRIELDERRLSALAPALDPALVRGYLKSFADICAGAGPIGRLPQRARFHWLVAARSTIIQTSAVHAGLCEAPETALERLMDEMVRLPAPEEA